MNSQPDKFIKNARYTAGVDQFRASVKGLRCGTYSLCKCEAAHVQYQRIPIVERKLTVIAATTATILLKTSITLSGYQQPDSSPGQKSRLNRINR